MNPRVHQQAGQGNRAEPSPGFMEKLATRSLTKLIGGGLFHNRGALNGDNLLYHRVVDLVQIKEFVGIECHEAEGFHGPLQRSAILLLELIYQGKTGIDLYLLIRPLPDQF